MKTSDPQAKYEYAGDKNAMRAVVGQTVTDVLLAMDPAERKSKVMVIDSDLGGSTNFNKKVAETLPISHIHARDANAKLLKVGGVSVAGTRAGSSRCCSGR